MLIIATVGLYSLTEDKIKKIILTGADILRFNFGHRLISESNEIVSNCRQIIYELNASTKIMIDVPTNKVRLGHFDDILYTVRTGQDIIIKSASYSPDCNQFVPIESENIGETVKKNQTITIGDGEVAFQVKEIIDKNSIKLEALNNGVIKTMRTFNTKTRMKEGEFMDYYKHAMDKIKQINPNYVAIPYVEENLYKRMVEELNLHNLENKLIIKIVDEIPEKAINELYSNPNHDMIMLDLGEIGVNMPFEKVGIYYEKIISIANQHNKPTIVSTHLLNSTIQNYIPSRAEIINLTSMIRNNISGIVLCHETALGERPAYTINVAKKIIDETHKTMR